MDTMNLLDYGSDSDEDRDVSSSTTPSSSSSSYNAPPWPHNKMMIVTAPVVTNSNSSSLSSLVLSKGYNPTANIVLAPKQGPSHPFKRCGGSQLAEPANIEDWAFEEQYQNFQRSGYALDMDSNTVMGNTNEYLRSQRQMNKPSVRKDRSKRQRLNLPDEIGDPDDHSPWVRKN